MLYIYTRKFNLLLSKATYLLTDLDHDFMWTMFCTVYIIIMIIMIKINKKIIILVYSATCYSEFGGCLGVGFF